MFVADGGSMVRFFGGKNDGWSPKAPKDTLLRPAPSYSIVAAGTPHREGNIYGFDKPNSRVIALTKVDGTYVAQYRLAGGARDWSDLRAMYVIVGAGTEPPTLVWMNANGVYSSILTAVPDVTPTASPAPSGSAAPPKATPTPSKKP
jgi:hypothetical protein